MNYNIDSCYVLYLFRKKDTAAVGVRKKSLSVSVMIFSPTHLEHELAFKAIKFKDTLNKKQPEGCLILTRYNKLYI